LLENHIKKRCEELLGLSSGAVPHKVSAD
jgi:hypothetical protein